MLRPVLFSLCCLVASLAGAIPRAASEDDALETRRLLAEVRRDRDPETWERAVASLEAGTPEQQAELKDVLADLAAERLHEWRTLAKRIDALAGRLGQGRGVGKAERAWDDAREHAKEWLFDTVRFPVPRDYRITGPKEGYGEARKRGDRAIRAHAALARHLDRALAPAFKLRPKKARRLRDDYEAAVVAYDRVAAHLDGDPTARAGDPRPDPFAVLLLQLRIGEFHDAADAYSEMEQGWRRLCLFHAYGRGILDWNAAHPFGMRREGLEGIRTINEYRLALGITPVVHNEKLARMAQKHAEEMVRLAYFDHRSPVVERATKELRAKLEGYDAHVVECIAGRGSAEDSVQHWKFDGGHHRDLIDPRWREAGMSSRAPFTYDAGAGGEGAVVGIDY